MNRPRTLTAVTACILTALLITSVVGPTDVAIACVCPDGRVAIEITGICSCCSEEDPDTGTPASGWEPRGASCNDCVDVPLRVPPLKNDAQQLQPLTADNRNRATPTTAVGGSRKIRPARTDHGHCLSLAMLSSVILLT